MKKIFTFLVLLSSISLNAQSWVNLGATCGLAGGSGEMKFKSNGNVVAVSFGTSSIAVNEYNGSNWTALPSPTTTGTIGWFDLEMVNDTAYLAVINSGMKVFKYNGTAWVQLGATVPGSYSSTNFDFTITPSGVPYIVNFADRKLHKFNGSAWSNIYTFPQGSWPAIISYGFTSDNTLLSDQNNDLLYVIDVNNGHVMKKYNGTAESVVGDTIIKHAPFYSYTIGLFKNNANDVFVSIQQFGKKSFVKKFNNPTWSNYGDTTNVSIGSGFAHMDFINNNSYIIAMNGTINKKVYYCAGAANPIIALDTISNSGFTQTTDIGVNPLDSKPYAFFNCSSTASAIMKYNGSLSTAINNPEADEKITIFPNPANSYLTVLSSNNIKEYSIVNYIGQTIKRGRIENSGIDLSEIETGNYIIQFITNDGNRMQQSIVIIK